MPEPVVNLVLTIVGFAMVITAASCLWQWIMAVLKWSRGESLVPLEPRDEVKWNGIDVLVAIILVIGATGIAQLCLQSVFEIELPQKLEDMEADERATVLMSGGVANLVAFLVSLAFVIARTESSLANIGFTLKRFAYDIGLGLKFFALMAPPIYAMQYVLHLWIPTEHPLIQLIREHPDPKFFLVSGFAAVLVAPLAEEYLFRGLLQGWLEQLGQKLSGANDPQPQQTETPNIASTTSNLPKDGTAGAYDSDTKSPDAARDATIPNIPLWPTFVSSILFAAAHFSHGPDPIPLFFFALGLGYLYKQTHRLVPCIVVHFCLNALTMLSLFASVYGPK